LIEIKVRGGVRGFSSMTVEGLGGGRWCGGEGAAIAVGGQQVMVGDGGEGVHRDVTESRRGRRRKVNQRRRE
jgi:hypothetical protein